jgi:hypothetical protein
MEKSNIHLLPPSYFSKKLCTDKLVRLPIGEPLFLMSPEDIKRRKPFIEKRSVKRRLDEEFN